MTDALWMALRLALAAILIVSAVGKLSDLVGFAEAIGRYRFLPTSLRVPAAWSLMTMEALTAALLLVGQRTGFWLAMGLFLLFAIAIGSALRRRLAIPCGCFGGDDLISPIALLRVGLLMAASVAGILVGFADPARLAGGWDLPMAATLAAGGLILGRLALLVPDVLAALGIGSATAPGSVAPSDTV